MSLTRKMKKKLARQYYEKSPQLKEKGITAKQFQSMVDTLEMILEGDLTQEELARLKVITKPNYTQYTAEDLKLLQKVNPEAFGKIKIKQD